MKIFILMLVALLVQGCASKLDPAVVLPNVVDAAGFEQKIKAASSPASGKEVEAPKPKVAVDRYLLEPCLAFTKMVNTNPSPRDVLTQRASDVKIHSECMSRHAALVKIVREAFNIP